MNKAFFLILLFLLLGSVVSAQKNVPVTAIADKSKILLGEQFDIVLGARFSDSSQVAFFAIDTLPHFEIVQKFKIDTVINGKEVSLSQKITLTSFDSGRWQIPALSLPASAIKTKPIAIDVVFSSPFDPKKDYHDVKDIIGVSVSKETEWYWYLIGVALLLLLFILLFPRKKKPVKEIELDANAYKTALSDLQKLKKEQEAGGEVKVYYVRLVDIFRKYLHKGKGIQSFSKTTDDLALQIKSLDLPIDAYDQLVQTLRLSDAVKFARAEPRLEENNQALEIIRKSIELIEKK